MSGDIWTGEILLKVSVWKPISYYLQGSLYNEDFFGGSVVKNLPASEGDTGLVLGWEDPLEKEMATHSSILVWKIT